MNNNTFNPLGYKPTDAELHDISRREVRSLLRSYNSRYDSLIEALQNSVDELRRLNRDTGRVGEVRVVVDLPLGALEVRDTGRGMSREEAQKWLRPHVTSKSEEFMKGLVSGHKGVGLTFLAYGFNSFVLESRTEDGDHFRITLNNARRWAMGNGLGEAPPMATVENDPTNAKLSTAGTSITVKVDSTTEPKELAKTFNTPEYTATLLETQTAIGTLQLESPPFTAVLEFQPTVGLRVTRTLTPGYRYPHMRLPGDLKILDWADLRATPGGQDIPPELRGSAHGVCHVYNAEEICEAVTSVSRATDLDDLETFHQFVRHHDVSMYVLNAYSSKIAASIGDAWGVPGNKKIHKAGVRVATDHQISQWSGPLTLPRAAHNANRLWLVVHAKGIEPDLGRKDFGPQLKDLVAVAEDHVIADMLTKAAPYLRPVDRQPVDEIDPGERAYQRKESPFLYEIPGLPALPTLSIPREEQDVVALTNQLMGNGVLGHLRSVLWSATSYDTHFEIDPGAVHPLVARHLPGQSALTTRAASAVGECKYGAETLLDDLVNGSKHWNDLGLLVCWTVPDKPRTLGGRTLSFTTAADELERRYAGVTHLARLTSGGEHLVRVISLKDLLERITS